jgi:hypothetical protein
MIRDLKLVPVFSIAFTDGEGLPTVSHMLTGDDPAGLFAWLIEAAYSIGFVIENAELPGGINGNCSHKLHRNTLAEAFRRFP